MTEMLVADIRLGSDPNRLPSRTGTAVANSSENSTRWPTVEPDDYQQAAVCSFYFESDSVGFIESSI